MLVPTDVPRRLYDQVHLFRMAEGPREPPVRKPVSLLGSFSIIMKIGNQKMISSTIC